jgi:pentapeptide MXKDX repeat protein
MRHLIRWSALAIFGLFVLPLFAADDVKKPDAAAKDAPAKDAPAKDVAAKDAPIKDAPAKDPAAKDAPAKDAPAKDAPAKDAPAKDAPAKDAPAKDAPAKDAPAKDTPKKDSDAKKDADTKDKKEEKKDKDWVLIGKLSGELVSVDETKKKVKVRIKVPKFDQGEANALVQSEANLQRAIASRDLNGIRQNQIDIATHQAKLYKPENKEVEYPTLEDVKVRLLAPPVTFDEDGKIKKYTAEELKKLKGDASLPGYPSEFGSLHSGQMVTITMMRKKDAKPPTPTRDPVTGKPMPVDYDPNGDYVPHASMIQVVADPPEKK